MGSINPNRQQMYTQKWEDMKLPIGRNGLADLFGHIRMIYSRVQTEEDATRRDLIYVITKNQDPEKLINDVIEPLSRILSDYKNLVHMFQLAMQRK